jgi:hypothetical protein
MVRFGSARQARLVRVYLGMAGYGPDRQGRFGMERLGVSWQGLARSGRPGWVGVARVARPGIASRGWAGAVGPGSVRSGMDRLGVARHVRLVQVWQVSVGMAWLDRQGMFCRARLGMAPQGVARQVWHEWHVPVRHVLVWQARRGWLGAVGPVGLGRAGEVCPGTFCPGAARLGLARQAGLVGERHV